MAAAPFPLTGQKPDFEPVEPLDSPGNDGVGDELIRQPFISGRIVEAKRGKFGRTPGGVDMRRRLAGSARIGAYRRVADGDAHIGVGQNPVVEDGAGEIKDADAIGLGDRRQFPLPDSDPPGDGDGPEIRVEGLDAAILRLDRQGGHFSPSP